MTGIPASIDRARQLLDARLQRDANSDMKRRDLYIYRREASVYFVDGMVSTEFLQRFILAPCGETAEKHFEGNLPDRLLSLLPIGEAETVGRLPDAVSALVAGKAVLIADGMAQAVTLDVRGFVRRGISPPLTESVVMGPHQAFNEALRDNVTLLRRMLPTPLLMGEMIPLGDVIPVTCCVLSLSDRVDEDTLKRVKTRLKGIRRDTVMSIGEVEQLVEDCPGALLPQCCLTERPDRAASFLLEGQVVLLLDGSPQALAAPVSFLHLMHTPDDTGMRWPYGTVTRLIRMMGALLTLLLPGLFVAFTLYHPEALPITLLTSVLESQAAVPLSIPGEMILMLLMLALISEAGMRIPGMVGSSLGTVSGLILGQAAVNANLVHPLMIIVVAVASLGNYALPNPSVAMAFRIGQFLFVGAACVGGLYGMTLTAAVMSVRLCAMRSMGAPYAAPVAPPRPHNPDLLARLPLWRQRLTGYLGSSLRPLRARGRMRWRR
ncbi:MAG: spore germination protein [Clostridia bacterium]|nr:spore germination protein [Clostridia bacterium]